MTGSNTTDAGIIAYAAGGIGNLGPGLDVLGCALTGAGDEVEVWWTNTPGIQVIDAGHVALPTDVARNACALAAHAVLRRMEAQHHRSAQGLALRVRKGLPLCAGQGGSSASAVAAAVAVNQLCVDAGFAGLDRVGLLQASLEAESTISGWHLDNIAGSLMGGVICVLGMDPPDVANIPVHCDIWFALAHPNIQVRTADARAVLPPSVSREVLVAQLGSVASMVTALAVGDLALFGRAMVDRVAEGPRSALIPGLLAAKWAATNAGAVGAGISGSGPTTFAVCASEVLALAAATAMCASYSASGLACTSRVAQIDFAGATWRRTPRVETR